MFRIIFFTYICHMRKGTKKTNREHYSIRIKPEILKRIRTKAEQESRNVNNYIEFILDKHA